MSVDSRLVDQFECITAFHQLHIRDTVNQTTAVPLITEKISEVSASPVPIAYDFGKVGDFHI